MHAMAIKMVVTDLDDTLLNCDKQISSYTGRILSQCKQKGIRIVFATARPVPMCMPFVEMIEPHVLISCGGAIAEYGSHIIHKAVLEPAMVREMIRVLGANPSVGYITMETETGYYVNKSYDKTDPDWVDYAHACVMNFDEQLPGGEIYVISAEINEQAVMRKMAVRFPQTYLASFTGGQWYNFSNKDASKWEAIRRTAAYLDIDVKDIVAFGDNFNDIPMIQHCGIGVAVGNAHALVKAGADAVCESNQADGVAKWLEANLLKAAKL